MLTEGFVTGANYWASNAGVKMWCDFDPEVIDDDFKRLKALRLDIIRLFPIWPDFQPLLQLRQCDNKDREVRLTNEKRRGYEPAEFAGLDETMLCRFSTVLDLAKKHGLRVCVGILTGWMSGRMFAPPALEGKNLLTDPTAVYYELRFVKEFVRRFVDREVIVGWTSGNETDCLAVATETEKANWSLNMYNAIRAVDPKRPILEDMHPLRPEGAEVLYERHDMFEATTVHPYAAFTPYALNEPIYSMRGLLHAVAEGKANEGVTGKPCFIEEVGTLGDFICSKEVSAGFVKVQGVSAFANGLTGFAWWCANEQTNLNYPPYDCCPAEQVLGLLNVDKSEKPAAGAMREVKELYEKITKFLGGELPPAQVDAVCLLEGGSHDWRNAFAGYVLSKQAGFNMAFGTHHYLPQSDFYILPSQSAAIRTDEISALAEKAEQGATVLINYERSVILNQMDRWFGIEPVAYSERGGAAFVDGADYVSPIRLELRPSGAEVLLREADGNPAFTVYSYGKGRMCFCTLPVEKIYAESHGGKDADCNRIYKILAEFMPLAVRRENDRIGMTVHPLENSEALVIAVNYSKDEQKTRYTLSHKTFKKALHGNVTDSTVTLAPYESAVFLVGE